MIALNIENVVYFLLVREDSLAFLDLSEQKFTAHERHVTCTENSHNYDPRAGQLFAWEFTRKKQISYFMYLLYSFYEDTEEDLADVAITKVINKGELP